MIEIKDAISNAFDATQLLIIFVIFLFTIFYPLIQSILKKEPKEDATIAKKILANEVRDTFWAKSFILFLSNLLIFCLFLPTFCYIILYSKWEFNYEIFSFLLVFLFIYSFLAWSVKLEQELFRKIKHLKKLSTYETYKFLLKNNRKRS